MRVDGPPVAAPRGFQASGRRPAIRRTGEDGTHRFSAALSPWAIERAKRKARSEVEGLPAGLRFHDLRHYFASLLIASGADVKTVQARLRHASAKTTLDVYGHIWPDRDESTRAAVAAVLSVYLTEQRRTALRQNPGTAGQRGKSDVSTGIVVDRPSGYRSLW